MLTKAQRDVLEGILSRAERGPSLQGMNVDPEIGARIWAESWIAVPLRAMLANVDGSMSARELSRDYGSSGYGS